MPHLVTSSCLTPDEVKNKLTFFVGKGEVSFVGVLGSAPDVCEHGKFPPKLLTFELKAFVFDFSIFLPHCFALAFVVTHEY